MRKTLLITAGTICVVLGTLGVFVPVLPTTPFLLLAAACYARSSHRFYQWLISNRIFGRYIRNYREGKGIPLRTKVVALTLLWLTIGYSAFFVLDSLIVRLLLLAIAVGVTFHLVLAKTYRGAKPGTSGNAHDTEI